MLDNEKFSLNKKIWISCIQHTHTYTYTTGNSDNKYFYCVYFVSSQITNKNEIFSTKKTDVQIEICLDKQTNNRMLKNIAGYNRYVMM